MATSSTPSFDPKQRTAIGYPSMDRYHLSNSHYPQIHPGHPIPYQPQAFPASSSFHNHGRYPNHAQNAHSTSLNGYYYRQSYSPMMHMMPEAEKKVSFGRVMLILMIVLVAGMCMMSLVTWFLFGTYIPEFQVSSLEVSNFSVTGTVLTGTWNASLAVSNPNENLEIHLDQIKSSIFYRQAMVGISVIQPFVLQSKQILGLNMSVPAEPVVDEADFQRLLLPRIAQDQKNGVMVFSLRMALRTNFTSADVVYRRETLMVYCDNLQVNFSSPTEGSMTRGSRSQCLIRLRSDEMQMDYSPLWSTSHDSNAYDLVVNSLEQGIC